MTHSAAQFIREHTEGKALTFVPEVKLLLSKEGPEALWKIVEIFKKDPDTPFPFWAFAWPGGQALARHMLDHPEEIKGKRVLDFAAGSGIGAIAAAKAGAKEVWAADIDELSEIAIQMNAEENDVKVGALRRVDMERPLKGFDLILAGDVCYEHIMGHRVLKWLRLCAEAGVEVWLADPGRAYAPKEGVEETARLTVPTSRELEDQDSREVAVWRLSPR